MSGSQKRALIKHRRSQAAKGLVRVEVKAAATDAALIREVAETLCRGSRRAKELRSLLRLTMRPQKSLLDLLAIDLPDEVVDRALARPVDRPRDVDL